MIVPMGTAEITVYTQLVPTFEQCLRISEQWPKGVSTVFVWVEGKQPFVMPACNVPQGINVLAIAPTLQEIFDIFPAIVGARTAKGAAAEI